MVKVSEHPFEIPERDKPRTFSGFVCIGFAGGRWWSGCDTNAAEDAYDAMIDASRAGMQTAAAVEPNFDSSFFPSTVRCIRTEGD